MSAEIEGGFFLWPELLLTQIFSKELESALAGP